MGGMQGYEGKHTISVPQIPQQEILTRTCVGPGAGTGTVSSFQGPLGEGMRIVCIAFGGEAGNAIAV